MTASMSNSLDANSATIPRHPELDVKTVRFHLESMPVTFVTSMIMTRVRNNFTAKGAEFAVQVVEKISFTVTRVMHASQWK